MSENKLPTPRTDALHVELMTAADIGPVESYKRMSILAETLEAELAARAPSPAVREALEAAKRAIQAARPVMENASFYPAYQPTVDNVLHIMEDALERARAALSDSAPAAPDREQVVRDMVSRFLAWRLPATFAPDGGIRFEGGQPIGTNLFTADEAEAMIRYLLDGVTAPAAPTTSEYLLFTPSETSAPAAPTYDDAVRQGCLRAEEMTEYEAAVHRLGPILPARYERAFAEIPGKLEFLRGDGFTQAFWTNLGYGYEHSWIDWETSKHLPKFHVEIVRDKAGAYLGIRRIENGKAVTP